MDVDPIFYVAHVFFFVWGAILLGFFVNDLIAEVKLKGWTTPRAAWLICLCSSSTLFVLLQLDPRGILGLYPPAALKLLEWCVILSILQSFAITGYMYLIALYKRNMSPVPPFLRNNWLVFNVSFTLVHIVLAVTGAILGNMFWFGVDGLALVVHESSHILVLNVCICKLSQYLQRLTQEQSSIGAINTNFSTALTKMLYVRVGSIVIALLAFMYQLFEPTDGAIGRISSLNTPIIQYDNSKFVASAVIGFLIAAGLQCLLLYMLRRPQAKGSERTSEKTTPKEMSASASHPSVASSNV